MTGDDKAFDSEVQESGVNQDLAGQPDVDVAALLAQVEALKAELAASKRGGEAEPKSSLPDKFKSVLEDVESGRMDEDGEGESVSGEEISALLAGADAAAESVEAVGELSDEEIGGLISGAQDTAVDVGAAFDALEEKEQSQEQAAPSRLGKAKLSRNKLEGKGGARGSRLKAKEPEPVKEVKKSEDDMPSEEEMAEMVRQMIQQQDAESGVSAKSDEVEGETEVVEMVEESEVVEVALGAEVDETGGNQVVGLSEDGVDTELTDEEIAAMIAAGGEEVGAGAILQEDSETEEVEVGFDAEDEGGVAVSEEAEDEIAGVPSESVMMDESEIAALMAESQAAEAAEVTGEEMAGGGEDVEDDGGVLSEDEIAALLAGASEGVGGEAGLEGSGGSDDDDGAMMSPDEIAALLAAAGDGGGAEAGDSGSGGEVSEGDDDDGMMSPDEIAALLAEAESGGDSQPSGGGGVLSADEISALLSEPDPEGGVAPDASEVMGEDAIAQLMAESQSMNSAGSIDELLKAAQDAEDAKAAKTTANSNAVPSSSNGSSSLGSEWDLAAVKAVPANLAVRALAVPIRFAEGKLVLRVAEPIDREAVDRISKATGFGVVTEVAPIGEVVSELRRVYREIRDDHARITLMTSEPVGSTFADRLKSLWRKVA